MNTAFFTLWTSTLALSFLTVSVQGNTPYDIVVYGGTSGGIVAAITARKEGKSVLLLSPDKHIGGLTANGLGWTDIGKHVILGGLSREFYHRVWAYYQKPETWMPDGQVDKSKGQHGPAIDEEAQLMYVFEPKAAEQVYRKWLDETGIPVEYGRLDLANGVSKNGARLTAIRTEDGREFTGKIFIDATYEGDLLALAKVSYTTGREPSSKYGESINGLQVRASVKNQLPPGIDPYIRKGDPSSGLLPGVNPTPTEPDGTGDNRVQAYCYRMCLTDRPENRLPIPKPASYREENYEILFRAIETGHAKSFMSFSPMPNHKTDSNNSGGISTDLIGGSQDYPDGNYATREKIGQAHKDWQLGLLWTLQNHPRVPKEIRQAHLKWGLPKDEFTDNGNWPTVLYVREARRLVGDYVLTQSVPEKALPAKRPIGLGAYTMDSHHVQRVVHPGGYLWNEGDVQKHINKPYQIDYGVLLPKQTECENLLVTFCISASHAAFASARMEPVFMILSQSAATAASLAIDDKTPVQQVPYAKLKAKLIAANQRLTLRPEDVGNSNLLSR
jgi:hypothetical protein